jgi:putative transposase
VYRGRQSTPVSDKRHRFPFGIIAHAVWLYFRFPLSLRLVEEMLLERGTVVSYEIVRQWALKFGPAYARRLRRKTPSRRDVWRLDSSPHRHGGMENRGQRRRLSLLGGLTGRHAPAVNVTTPAE